MSAWTTGLKHKPCMRCFFSQMLQQPVQHNWRWGRVHTFESGFFCHTFTPVVRCQMTKVEHVPKPKPKRRLISVLKETHVSRGKKKQKKKNWESTYIYRDNPKTPGRKAQSSTVLFVSTIYLLADEETNLHEQMLSSRGAIKQKGRAKAK